VFIFLYDNKNVLPEQTVTYEHRLNLTAFVKKKSFIIIKIFLKNGFVSRLQSDPE